jgi:hypothetical protein
MGSRSNLLRTLAAASGVASAGGGAQFCTEVAERESVNPH